MMKVSVLMITYNHQPYLTEAIESVLAQELDFDFELVIGEDCSSDGTREIVKEYQQRYPKRIRALLHGQNVGMLKNFVETLEACRGQYVALLEGDDYWTSPKKLQWQTEFLDRSPHCSACFHSAIRSEEGKGIAESILAPPPLKDSFTLDDLMTVGNFVPTASLMFRKKVISEIPPWFWDLAMADMSILILLAQHGSIGYIDKVMSVYRIHETGVWNGKPRVWRLHRNIEFYEKIGPFLGSKYLRIARQQIARRFFKLSAEYFAMGNLREARKYAWKSIASSPINPYVALSKRLRLLMMVWFPRLQPYYRGIKNQLIEARAKLLRSRRSLR